MKTYFNACPLADRMQISQARRMACAALTDGQNAYRDYAENLAVYPSVVPNAQAGYAPLTSQSLIGLIRALIGTPRIEQVEFRIPEFASPIFRRVNLRDVAATRPVHKGYARNHPYDETDVLVSLFGNNNVHIRNLYPEPNILTEVRGYETHRSFDTFIAAHWSTQLSMLQQAAQPDYVALTALHTLRQAKVGAVATATEIDALLELYRRGFLLSTSRTDCALELYRPPVFTEQEAVWLGSETDPVEYHGVRVKTPTLLRTSCVLRRNEFEQDTSPSADPIRRGEGDVARNEIGINDFRVTYTPGVIYAVRDYMSMYGTEFPAKLETVQLMLAWLEQHDLSEVYAGVLEPADVPVAAAEPEDPVQGVSRLTLPLTTDYGIKLEFRATGEVVRYLTMHRP